ncbi:MAG: DUF3500 domain-containing protein [Roseibacillus sp.]|nr:DUF3500 domain-containing protein [Roseibacillus sp.]
MNAATPLERRHFLRSSTAAALGILGPTGSLLSAGQPVQKAAPAESLVKVLYESLNEKQRKAMCFAWDHVDPKRGLLRTRIENNWRITNPIVASNFYNKDQQALIRGIFEGMTSPDWHERFDQQLKDDVGGFGKRQSIAIFGEPGSGKFQFVLTSRHMTLRCDGDSAEHVAFGGPILYAHEGERLYEKPDHPNNVFWHQAVEANKLFQTLSRSQRKEALLTHGMPSEELVGFKGKGGAFQGCPVSDFTDDQRSEVQRILKILLEPFRQSDRDEVSRCLKSQGGLDGCHLAFYKEGDLGDDKIYDNWRLEGPSFVWYFRGRPHVHVWVNVAENPSVKLNSSQDSVGV